jgi:hypothetical protein
MNGICLFLLITLAMPHALWARGGGGCLAEGTRVLTPSGPVPIETLVAGDDVWTVVDGQLRPATVQALIRVQPDDYIELELAHGRLEVTHEHPIQVAAGVFRQAAFLHAGDILWGWRDERLNPTRV